MPNSFYSYKTIPNDAIQLTWYIYESLLPTDGVIKQWKKNKDLKISVRAFINNAAVLQSVSEGSSVSFYICYHSLNKLGGTSLHGLAKKIPFRVSEEATQDLDIEDVIIPGDEIAGSTEITFYAVLEKSDANSEPSVFAHEKGAILFENSVILHLEGKQALFPVKAIDFSESSEIVGKNSLYFLKKRYFPLESDFRSAYTLFFNSKHILFSKINSENENDLASSYLLKMIMYDVYRTIVEDALNQDTGLTEIIDSADEIYTLRAVYSRIIRDLINFYFPDKNLESMKKLLDSDESSRNALYTAIQDYIIGD